MEKEEYLAVLRSDARELATVARLGFTEPVSSCPGWSVADLVVHVGGVHRAQANIVESRAQEPMGIKREIFEGVPGLLLWLESSTLIGGISDLANIPPGLVDWFEEGAGILLDALAEADPDEAVWSWSGNNRVAHYLRMMPIETAVHRWDAQLAHGRTEPIDRALAADGIAHAFDVMMPFRRARGNAPRGEGESFRFVETDGPGAWTVHFDGEPRVTDDGEAAVTVSGRASDLFLFLWRRLGPDALAVEGERDLLPRYFELVPPM